MIEEEKKYKVFRIEGLLDVFQKKLSRNNKIYYFVKIDDISLFWWNLGDAEQFKPKIGKPVICYYTEKISNGNTFCNINSLGYPEDYEERNTNTNSVL